MYNLIIALIVLLVLCFSLLGVIIGILFINLYPPAPRLHPEMYNSDGSIRTDILHAVTFEPNYDDEDDDYEEAESS
jgi:hypothetical protein